MSFIRIRGARTHNLANIDLDLPRDRLIVFTGLSGSGKSSLAFDTLYAEGQRRYVESLSTYARQFLSLMEKPDVDHIEGLSPAIAIEQKTASHNPRSTVGTVTEVYDYLRLLYARAGEPRCPVHGVALQAQTVTQMVDQVLDLPEGTRALLLAPVVSERKGETREILDQLRRQGFVRARIDGEVVDLDDVDSLSRRHRHTVEVVVDRFVVRPDHAARLAESFETALAIGESVARVLLVGDPNPATAREFTFSAHHACAHCGYSIADPEPRLFSFNNPAGACPCCDGLGVQPFFDPDRVIRDDTLSLAAGAVQGWDRRNPFYFKLLESLARHFGFTVDTPFGELPDNVRSVILHGSGEETIAFSYHGGRRRRHRFEGVLPNLERRYRETDSSAMREDLARFVSTRPCPDCKGSRLREEARNVFVGEMPIHALTALPIGDALERIARLGLTGHRAAIAERVVQEIGQRLRFLVNVGLNYLTLDRTAESLSGGEAQRIRLASQIGSGLTGVMYVLDEPSIGLHPRDNGRLLETLCSLRDLGNTVIVVEHDEEAIRAADHVVDLGPGAGVHGGRVVAEGPPAVIESTSQSLTGRYLAGIDSIEVPRYRRPRDGKRVVHIRGARGNNLRRLDVEFPVGLLTCVTGVSGSGKSTLVNDTLYPAMAQRLHRTRLSPAPFDAVEGLEQFDKVIDIDQSPIGRTPRSNAATYTGLFTPIRDLFATTPEARARGYKPGRFSFNVRGGRCEACEGDGMLRVEMHFLPDIYVPCDACKGARYNRETLEVRYKGRTIAEVLDMTVDDAAAFFAAVPAVRRKLDTLIAVGLGYLRIGQSATTLSGGEAQRMKLSRELSRRDTGRTLYILDEPTTGLHFHDVRQLLGVLHRLCDDGNTIVVIEHNLDVIKTADWIIDLGPDGGEGGGRVVTTGTPEDVASTPGSFTGYFLQPLLRPPAAHTG